MINAENHCKYNGFQKILGGPEGARTLDPLTASQILSQTELQARVIFS